MARCVWMIHISFCAVKHDKLHPKKTMGKVFEISLKISKHLERNLDLQILWTLCAM